MRILTVSHYFEAHGGGIERVAGQLNRQFQHLGVSAAWAASDCDPSPDAIDAIPLACANPIEKFTGLPMPLPSPGSIRMLAREIEQCDAVIIHDAIYVTSICAMLLAKRRRRRVILIQHIAGIMFASRALRAAMSLANRLITQPMLKAADVRIFISDTTRKELMGGDPRVPCELIFNGVDQTIFHPGCGKPQEPSAVARLALRPETRHILFVGRYVEKKGLSVLREVAQKRPELTFFLVGSGPIDPASWKLPNLHDLGPRSPPEVANLYRWADLLVLPSVGEGYPLVVQEAMACGLPVICGEPTNRADPGADAWLTGVYVDLSDVEGSSSRVVQAIDRLALSDDDRTAMASYAASRYQWSAMAERLVVLAHSSTPKVL